MAQYMQNLAAMLGHETAVHLEAIKPVSTQLAAKIDHEYIPKVESHLALLRNGEGQGMLASRPRAQCVDYRRLGLRQGEPLGVVARGFAPKCLLSLLPHSGYSMVLSGCAPSI
ncbi:MAG: hypothetical protein Q8K36_02580 [Alphaproteobacteria bacterium]|nr:hypothetical protein [Alphaproteobacteria bacterium]